MRVRGILQRADRADPRFAGEPELRAFLANMERAEGDQPQPLEDDLASFRSAGFARVGVFWLETREAVWGAMR